MKSSPVCTAGGMAQGPHALKHGDGQKRMARSTLVVCCSLLRVEPALSRVNYPCRTMEEHRPIETWIIR